MSANRPWLDKTREPEARLASLLAAMTRDEKLLFVNGHVGAANPNRPAPPEGGVGSAGFIVGSARLGIPTLQETDASLGVANLRGGEGATALPSGLAIAASWDEALTEEGGAMIGAEARAKGFAIMLAGGVNLTREARCGRNFEYLGEDPLLAGVLVGASIRGVQSNRIVCTIKHFALNAQETGRFVVSAQIDEAALRESDLLAFQIGIERGDPGSVMTAYNRINGIYCGEHDFLLNTVLKGDWGFSGWTMSDWGGCHSAERAALAGLDQESGQEIDREPYFQKLGAAIDGGQMPQARLDDMAARILRPLIARGVLDDPPQPGGPIDRAANLAVAQRAAEAGIVLLKNEGDLLPLARAVKSIAVIGAHADIGVLSGGGSSSVVPWGGVALEVQPQWDSPWAGALRQRWHPSSPLAALRAAAPDAKIEFDNGDDAAAAAALARRCEVVIVFAAQWTSEFVDVPDLSLPGGQDDLIAAVAAANAKTIVVLQTGGPVLMPWLARTPAVLEAWYPGLRGGEAIAAALFGVVNPSGRLPITFPRSEADTPNPALPGAAIPRGRFDAPYPEGADAGYRWYAREGKAVLFPFGFGLSYTRFAYSDLRVSGGAALRVSGRIANIGARAGRDVAQVYLVEAAGRKTLRLIGWKTIDLAPGASATIEIEADPRIIGRYDPQARCWRVDEGRYTVALGAHAGDLAFTAGADMAAFTRAP
jgi:beta-glucosidase